MKISCLVIDDEPLARQGLKEYIGEVDFLSLEGTFDNPLKAMPLLQDQSVQLLFLDIQMPKITGLDFFRSLSHPPPVIFTTAYPQYALDGFNLAALDYLVKPVSFERFLQAALKAKEYYELRARSLVTPGEEPLANAPYFFIKSDNKLVKIGLEEILVVEALQNYVTIHTTTKKYITYLTFKSIETYLPPALFIKTHKSYMVAAQKIESIEGNEIRIGPHSVPISRNLKEEVMEKILKNKVLKR